MLNQDSPGIPVPLVTRATSDTEVLPASQHPLTSEELHRLAGPKVLEILQEMCAWTGDEPLGDIRFAVFSFDAAEDVRVRLQVMSRPRDGVVHVMARKSRDEEQPEDYENTVYINHEADSTQLGRELIDVLYHTFAYRGLVPLEANLAWVGFA